MSRLSTTILLGCIALTFTSCSNPFAIKKNKWVQVTESNSDYYQAVYVDENRTVCDDEGDCTAWVKMIFAKPQQIPYSGKKKGEKSGYLLAKRVDSSVKYFCKKAIAQIISYQIYDESDKLIDSKWIDGDRTPVQRNTIYYDLWKHVCKKSNK